MSGQSWLDGRSWQDLTPETWGDMLLLGVGVMPIGLMILFFGIAFGWKALCINLRPENFIVIAGGAVIGYGIAKLGWIIVSSAFIHLVEGFKGLV